MDSLPVPVAQFYLLPTSTGDWKAHGATFGKVPSKKQTIFGYKLHLLITLGGVILDFELAPTNASDLNVGFELLSDHSDLTVLGDKGYISANKAAELWRSNRIRLLTLPLRNQKRKAPRAIRRLFNAARQIIETVNSQLSKQFHNRDQSQAAHRYASTSIARWETLTPCNQSPRLPDLAQNPISIIS